jgi:hypothetical protein
MAGAIPVGWESLMVALGFAILLLPSGLTALGGYRDVVLGFYGLLLLAGARASNGATFPASNRPSATPMPRSMTTLMTAFRQSWLSRPNIQTRTSSPATLGKT